MPSVAITGASRGLGLAFARYYASLGYIVIGLVRDPAAAKAALSKTPGDNDHNIHMVQADVTDYKSLHAAAEATSSITGGSLDILINNAVFPNQTFTAPADLTPQALEHEVTESTKVNVLGVAYGINAFLPLIRKGQLKKVIAISSGTADDDITINWGLWHSTPYSMSKAASNTLIAKYHASTGKREGILFLSISPGAVNTQEKRAMTEQDRKDMFEMVSIWKRYEPSFQGPVQPDVCAKMIDSVIQHATIEKDGGHMVSQHGNKRWI